MKEVVIYGLGSWVESHYLWLKDNFKIIGAYDRDEQKKTKAKMLNLHFISLEELAAQAYDTILITSTFDKEIRQYLTEELHIKKEVLSGNEMYEEHICNMNANVNRSTSDNRGRTFVCLGGVRSKCRVVCFSKFFFAGNR
jgi:ketol-acid reductoisomerase